MIKHFKRHDFTDVYIFREHIISFRQRDAVHYHGNPLTIINLADGSELVVHGLCDQVLEHLQTDLLRSIHISN